MSEVFISYAREDQAQAERLHGDLQREGFDVWIDTQSLLAGSNWSVEITGAIRSSQYFVLLLSTRSTTKRGFIHREIREALDVVGEMPEGEIFLIPARLEACDVTHEALRKLHWVDLFPDWGQGLAQLIRSLRRDRSDVARSAIPPQRSLRRISRHSEEPPSPTPLNIRTTLREIQEAVGLTKAELARELNIDIRTIDKLLLDSDTNPWRLDRDSLNRYILFAHKHGFDPFRVE